MMTRADMHAALRRRLLGSRDAESGVWSGRLSSSALATALAVEALRTGGDAGDARLASRGAAWLDVHSNGDGGWGDTPESASNVSATLIAAAALRGSAAESRERLAKAEQWIAAKVGGAPTPGAVAAALKAVYGRDRTFAVPIMAFLAMAGGDAAAWRSVPSLPFVLALLPQRLYRFLRLQVVSYALPALIAVGFCRHVCTAKARGGWAWGRLLEGALLRRLERLQPSHGGFLDAVPLTAFVCLSLSHAGLGGHAVARKGLEFLRRTVRSDGGWPIDSNLRTWVTTLSARAVWRGETPPADAWKLEMGSVDDAERVAAWLVKVQTKVRHPYTGSEAGGWAWTDLPGGVPDADDTSGALIALKHLKAFGCRTDVSVAVRSGIRWLQRLQNADGGMPTFCRGWGRLPFDRSCADISAHALEALALWADVLPSVPRAMARLVRYLERSQASDGSWSALWFGHQEARDGRNPVVGTARVVAALRAALQAGSLGPEGPLAARLLQAGESWLAARQRDDGAWGVGAEPTVEETSLAVCALKGGGSQAAASRGIGWLVARGEAGLLRAAPIGLYFALLWYHEDLYPLIWSLEALGLGEGEEIG